MSTILHITSRGVWRDAQTCGEYRAPSLESQGFIHCSKPEQVAGVANFLFQGRTDLVLLCIDSNHVKPEIRYENLEGGQKLFPHVYGPINVDSVTAVLSFLPNADGLFELPVDLADISE